MRIIVILFFSFWSSTTCAQTITEVTSVEAKHLLDSLNKINITIIDGRDSAMFHSGHIENAIQINAYKDDVSKLLQKYLKEEIIFLYCTTRNRSDKIIEILKEKGYQGEVIFMTDGVTGWKENEFELIRQ